MALRFKLPPGGDIPRELAARRVALTPAEFDEKLPELLGRGFPPPDPTTGKFDLDAIDEWRRARFPHLFGKRLTVTDGARDARDVVRARVAGLSGG